jgi:protein-disulfide isomerase
MNQRALFATGVAVLLLGWGGAAALRSSRTPRAVPPVPTASRPAPDAPQDTALTARTKGSPSAPITVIEIADFQCPACRLFWAETMPQLQKEYVDPGKVRFVFVNFPLVQIHHNAAAAAQLAMCGARQNRFWPIHDALFDHQSAWAGLADPSAYFFSLGAAAGLQTDTLVACLADTTVRTAIAAEAEGVARAGVRSTPSFIIEGGLIEGAAPIESWRPILDSIYDAKTDSR